MYSTKIKPKFPVCEVYYVTLLEPESAAVTWGGVASTPTAPANMLTYSYLARLLRF